MKAGRTIQEFAAELTRRSEAKRDFRADTRELAMLNGSELLIPGCGEFGINQYAHGQIAATTGIPSKYYERLRDQYPTLLDQNVNALFRAEPDQRLIRTLDGNVRAVLSNAYRCFDNDDLMAAVFPILSEIPDVFFPSMEVTDTRMYVTAVSPRLTAEVKVGDVVQGGVRISNSEVGSGQVVIDTFVYRLWCLNGATVEKNLRRRHVGRRIEGDEVAREIFRDETIKADDEAFFLMVKDVVAAAVNESRFAEVVERLRNAGQTPEIVDVSAGVTEIQKRLTLTDQESKNVLTHLAQGGDLTQYGAIQAVTRTAQDAESYDRSMELEGFGGLILGWTPTEWRDVAMATVAR